MKNAVCCVQAGEIIREIWQSGNLGAVDKGGGITIEGKKAIDVQTQADRKAEELIVSSLMQTFPALAVVGEEGTETADEVQISAASAVRPRLNLLQKHKVHVNLPIFCT